MCPINHSVDSCDLFDQSNSAKRQCRRLHCRTYNLKKRLNFCFLIALIPVFNSYNLKDIIIKYLIKNYYIIINFIKIII